ncbi:MAG TPA: hypothetical protein EYN67_01240 [Flavobacteriales bacterium]|nr:hypothetical protein [Flavobacteriales bacterium]
MDKLKILKEGDSFEFDYPFYGSKSASVGGDEIYLIPGCHKDVEWDDVFSNIYYTANFTGKIIFDVLAVTEMPGRYVDRVIVKRRYLLPNGEKYNAGRVECITCLKLLRYISGNQGVFPWDYEVEEGYEAVNESNSQIFN